MNSLSGYGMLAAKNSVLNSSRDVNISMYGAFARYNTTITCNIGSTCNLNCKTSGCIGLTFICDNNVSSCSIDCNNETDECPSNGNETIVNKWIDIMYEIDVTERYFTHYFEKEYENILFDLSSECDISSNNSSDADISTCYRNSDLPRDIGKFF